MSCSTHTDVEEGLRPCARCGREFCGNCTIVVQGRVICAACKDDEVRDRLSGVGTESPLAGLPSRATAWFIDWLSKIGLVFGLQRASNGGMAALIFAWVIYTVYEALMLTRYGQTIGKMCVRIRVVQDDGSAIDATQAWMRAGVRGFFVSWLAVIDYVPALLTTERTCIHDRVAGTRVVKDYRLR